MTARSAEVKTVRAPGRAGRYRAGYYTRGLVTRIGKLELRVPRDREGRFSTELFARYQRSEKALVSSRHILPVLAAVMALRGSPKYERWATFLRTHSHVMN